VSHRILLHVDVNARTDQEAVEWAKKLEALLKDPFVRTTIQGQGIQLTGQPVVYAPTRIA